jgi:uncharacterized protein
LIRLSRVAARTILLGAQGLLEPPASLATRADALAAIRRMGALQSDTINVVARSPYLVLWTRLGEYDPRWLDELLAEREVFEQWSHEACWLPMDDYPLYRRLTIERARARHWLTAYPEEVARVLAHVRDNGAVRSVDFERTDGKKGTWWDWKPEKRALEALFGSGELMVARRERFQRVYDLRERLLPDWNDDQAPPIEAVRREQAIRAARALGVATARWLADYFRTPKAGAADLLESLADDGALARAEIEDVAEPAYVHADHVALAERAARGEIESTVTTLLSPFDPVVWDRERLKTLFGMDYRIECYTPAPKRKYGYFCLPILHRGALVGRLDAKAHRKDGVFEVRALHLESGVEVTEPLVSELAAALVACAAWHRTPGVVVSASEPPAMASALNDAIGVTGTTDEHR